MDKDLRPEVKVFANIMEQQLRANDHKGGWKHCDPEWLLMRLREEVEELAEALAPSTHCGCREAFCPHIAWPDPTEVVKEAADVANFAMMVADVIGGLKTRRGGDAHGNPEISARLD